MIELEEIGKRYARDGDAALTDVSLHVPAGAAWGVVGPNGAGKSTLFALVLGFLRPSAGRLSIDDQPPRDYVRRHGACYLPERFGPPALWPVRSMLHAFARLEGAAPAAADAALEAWGLQNHADHTIGELSHGLRQRAGIAQALLAPRALVVLDEPTEGLDPIWRIRLREAVNALRADGRTILVASHDLAEVERMTDRAVLLDDGRVRELLDSRMPESPTHYRIRLLAAHDAVTAAFPDANVRDDQPATYDVVVTDARELSARLAAIIDAGAVVLAVEPLHEGLEGRVRRALGEDA